MNILNITGKYRNEKTKQKKQNKKKQQQTTYCLLKEPVAWNK